MKDLLFTAIAAALEAGQAIVKIYHSGFKVRYKLDHSPLTTADLASNRIIKERLSAFDIPLISEEDKQIPYEIRQHYKNFWLIDPLDGTKEFVKTNGEFTVNIALIASKVPVMGVIYAPVPDLLYFAEASTGSYRVQNAWQKLQSVTEPDRMTGIADALPVASGNRPYTVVISRSHMNEDTKRYIKKLASAHAGMKTISTGSSLKFCAVAEGAADIYPRLGPTWEWDTAAGNAIAGIAGCKVLSADDSKPLTYNKPDLLNPGFIACR